MFDCVNMQKRIPVDEYSPGASLPPHLSPFTEDGPGDYVPPERQLAMEEEQEVLDDVVESEDEDETVEPGQ